MEMSKTPQYRTLLFTDIWNDVNTFKSEFAESPFNGAISSTSSATTKDSLSVVFYLLYARYGNNPIANNDINQFKYKVFSIIFQYGPTWEKRLDIQEKLRNISDDELRLGSKAIYNHALNPSTAPSTQALEELTYINDQNTTHFKKSKMDAYMQLWELLRTDVTEDFLRQFKKCFKIFVTPERPLLYITDNESNEEV